MPKTILQHSTKDRFNNLRFSIVGHFSFLKRSSYSIPNVFTREQAQRLLTELFLMQAHPQTTTDSRPEQRTQEPGAQEICITQRMHRDSAILPFCEPSPSTELKATDTPQKTNSHSLTIQFSSRSVLLQALHVQSLKMAG